MFGATPHERAYFAPFVAFFIPFGLSAILGKIFEGRAFWMIAHSEYWVHPAQTILCGAMLIHYRRFYRWRFPPNPVFTTAIGMLALAIWIAPQELFSASPRRAGFNPAFFGADGWPYITNLSLRFLRLVFVVPIVEELFWRGFLLRYLIRDSFTHVPVGTFEWKSCMLVALFFMLEHQPSDYPAAFITGLLYNAVAYRTLSIGSCILAHAVTNLLLGIYIMRTQQWGFW